MDGRKNRYIEEEKKMVKPNTTFNLSIRDIEVIEIALRAKAGRRGIILQRDTSHNLEFEMDEIRELLEKIHEQKHFDRPKKGIYVSG